MPNNKATDMWFQILEDILDLSKIEAGQLDIDTRQTISIHGLLDNTMKLAKAFRIQRKKGHIEISESVDADIAHYILGDQFRVQQGTAM